MRQMGQMAMENLFKLMSGQESVAQVKVEAELIVRGSTGKVQADSRRDRNATDPRERMRNG